MPANSDAPQDRIEFLTPPNKSIGTKFKRHSPVANKSLSARPCPKAAVGASAANSPFVRSADLDLLPQYRFAVLVRRTAALSPYRSFCKLSDAANAPGCSRPKSAVDEICMRRIPAYPKQPFNTLCSVIVGQRAALRTKPASSTPVHFLLPLEHAYQLVAFTLVLIADVHIGYALMNGGSPKEVVRPYD